MMRIVPTGIAHVLLESPHCDWPFLCSDALAEPETTEPASAPVERIELSGELGEAGAMPPLHFAAKAPDL
eukprot:1285082-Lingulodinium_polyedra.AAC.1